MTPSAQSSPSLPRRRFLTNSLALAASAVAPWPLSALEVPTDFAFLRLVDAVELPGLLFMRVDGIEADPAGFKQGFATEGIALAPKTYQVELEHETLGKEKLTVTLETGKISTIVAYKTEKPPEESKVAKAGPKPGPKKDGPRLVWHLDESPASIARSKDVSVTIVQLTAQDVMEFQVAGTPATARAGEPVRVPITRSMGTFPTINHQGKEVCVLNYDVRADKLVVFFTGTDGSLQFAQLRNDVQ
jgi:hypothetical protein